MHSTINSLTEKNSALEKKNAELEAEVANLKQQLSKQKVSSGKFANIRGLKIKKLPTGVYDETMAYCLHCESPMSSSHDKEVLKCTKCEHKSSIQARYLSVVISELKGEELPMIDKIMLAVPSREQLIEEINDKITKP